MSTPPAPRPLRRGAGFTLIELLVVIAIIAILTAIIFPVFATLRENARQKTSIASLHDIQTGLAQFKLDQGRYPEVLFGYALPTSLYPSARMDNALALAQQQNAAAQYFPGLYPEYINDPRTFTDGNNNVTDFSKTSAPLTINYLSTTASPATSQNYLLQHITTRTPTSSVATSYYLADAYDISPAIQGSNTFVGGNSSPTYVVRYQTSWTDISSGVTGAGSFNGTAPANNKIFVNYNRQLRWTNPPADTYVTSTSYHVPNSNKVIVLWEGGDAKAIDASRFLGGAAGACTGTDAVSASGATFWQVSPTDPTSPGYGGMANCP